MQIVVGCDVEVFKKYYRNSDIHDYFKAVGVADAIFGELGPVEEAHIRRDPSHLIVLREGNEIIGHAIWHEECMDGFSEPGDKEVREALEKLLRGRRDFVELHEVWLENRYRGRGYGNKFFEFFEDSVRKKGCDSIVYFTGNPAAIAICRTRGYKEAMLSFPEKEKWHVFCLPFNQQ